MGDLPPCRHRGCRVAWNQWICESPGVEVLGGVVTAEICRDHCPHIDHVGTDEQRPTPAAVAAGERIHVALNRQLISVAMITAPRPISTVERSISELRNAGFQQSIRLFAEPGSTSVTAPEVITDCSDEVLGSWQNWRRAARTMLREGDSPFILLCEDDIELVRCAALALQHAIDRFADDSWGLASLYSPEYNFREYQTADPGWSSVSSPNHWGALAWCFSRASLSALLNSKTAVDHRGDRDIDLVVSEALHSQELHTYFHRPSLAAHTGFGVSSLGHLPQAESAALDFDRSYDGYVDATHGRPVQTMEFAPATAHHIRVVGDRSVAVIIPNYNCGEYLPPCIESLKQQSIQCEIVVVDDGSTDGSVERMQQYDPGIRVLRHTENQGAQAARVTGVRATRSEWVVLADADAVYFPDYLKCLLEATQPNTSVSYCAMRRTDVNTGQQQVIGGGPFDRRKLWWGNYISMCSLIRRSALPLDVMRAWNHFDDWQLWLHLASGGHQFVTANQVLFEAFLRPEGKSALLERQSHRGAVEVANVRRPYAALIGCADPISVVIPGSNSADLTAECLWHLTRYTGLPLTFVYVDNGSHGNTIPQVQDTADVLQISLEIIRNPTNRGFTEAVNQGIAASDGRHVLCQNNDCFVGPQCVDRMFAELTQTPGVAAVGPLTGDNSRHSLRHLWRRRDAGVRRNQRFDYSDAVSGARVVRRRRRGREDHLLAFFCTLMNREAIARCGSLDQTTREFRSGLGADDEWCRRVRTAGWKLKIALDAYAAHLGQQTFRRLGIDRHGLQRQALQQLQMTEDAAN